jgi:surfactin synthase thioesterase subunit
MKGRTMSSSSAVTDRWIRRFHAGAQGAVQLVCLPHAGGSASYFFPLSQLLSPDIEVLAVQYPGRQDRRDEPFIDTIPDLADEVTEVLEGWIDRPFALFGHSMGAVLGYEVARRLDGRGGPDPLCLFASGRRAPSRYRSGTVHLSDDAGVVAELRRVGGTDHRFLGDRELLAAILPATRNDYKAVETYKWAPGPRLACPISVLVGDSDPQTTVDEAAAWAEHSTGAFDIRVFSGGHFYLDAHRTEIAAEISRSLDRIRGISFEGAVREV